MVLSCDHLSFLLYLFRVCCHCLPSSSTDAYTGRSGVKCWRRERSEPRMLGAHCEWRPGVVSVVSCQGRTRSLIDARTYRFRFVQFFKPFLMRFFNALFLCSDSFCLSISFTLRSQSHTCRYLLLIFHIPCVWKQVAWIASSSSNSIFKGWDKADVTELLASFTDARDDYLPQVQVWPNLATPLWEAWF